MVLEAVKQLEKSILLNDVDNINILGLDQGSILLYTGTIVSRSSSILRTIIGGILLTDEDQKVFYRHSSAVKITHASINATQSLCCFVTRSESHNYDTFVAEISPSSTGRLFSMKFSRSSSIRAYFTSCDVILILYRDSIHLFRMPNSASTLDKAVAVDRDGQISECIYYQWDTLQQRLHVIEKRSPGYKSAAVPNGFHALVYRAFIINARGHFDRIMKIDFDFKIPDSTSNHSSYEILSNETSLFLCWQSTIKEDSTNVEYAVISLGHGRSLYVSKQLNPEHSQIFQSRRVHFGLLNGDYVFAALRGEFVHLLNFNIYLNFHNHIFLSDEANSLPYDTKYTTQRGLGKISTLLYEKKSILTYTIQINANELVAMISPTNMESIIAYGSVAAKKENILMQILAKILFEMYDELKTKDYLKDILTALIFIRLLKRIHHEKYLLAFPATAFNHHHQHHYNEASVRSLTHSRDHLPEYISLINIDKEYYDKLRSSFELSRKYRHKLPYYHPIMTTMEETAVKNKGTSSPTAERASPTSGFFTFGKRSTLPISNENKNGNPKSAVLTDPINKHLFNSVSKEIQQLHSSWEEGRIKDVALEYVQATQDQCDCLIRSFTNLANFDRTQPLVDDDNNVSLSKRYETLLVVLEKLYLAMDELGFSPTEELKRTLLQISYHVMPFDRFITAIEQNILTLTEEFVSRVILELDDDPKSYAIKEQLILMLPNTNMDVHSRLFGLIKNDRAKRMTAQLLVTRNFSADSKNKRSSSHETLNSTEIQADEIMTMNSDSNASNNHSRLVEQAVVTFLRDCNQHGILDEDEMKLVKIGASALASSTP